MWESVRPSMVLGTGLVLIWAPIFWLMSSFQHFSPFHFTVFLWFPKLVLPFQEFCFCLCFFFPQEENLGFSLYPLTAQEFFSKAKPRPDNWASQNWATGYRQLKFCATDFSTDTDLLGKLWLKTKCTGIAHTSEIILMSIMPGLKISL